MTESASRAGVRERTGAYGSVRRCPGAYGSVNKRTGAQEAYGSVREAYGSVRKRTGGVRERAGDGAHHRGAILDAAHAADLRRRVFKGV